MTTAEHDSSTIGIVIPTYNEAGNVPLLFEGIFEALPDVHVLIVDDHSPDGTADVARAWAQENGHAVQVLDRPSKNGLGTAYLAAFRHILQNCPDWDWVIQMDADLSHDPNALPDLTAAAAQADLVIGSRYRGGRIENWSFWRHALSKAANIMARLFTGLPLRDCTSGFRCMRRQVLEQIDLDAIQSNGYAFLVEFAFRAQRAGFTVAEHPITFCERREGESKLGLPIATEALRTLLRLGLERFVRR